MSTKIPKIERSPSIAEQVYKVIKDMIVTNKVSPNKMLLESQLAKNFHISRSPIREALTRLQHEGFVELIPWRGARVAALTPKYIRDVYDLRMALECWAAHKSAHLLNDQVLDDIEKELEAERKRITKGRKTFNIELEIRFHSLYIDLCDNNMLRDALNKLNDHLERIRAFAGTIPQNVEASFKEHQQVLEAMRTKNPDTLEKAIENHISNIIDRVVEALESNAGK